jgi:hypothetical protein
MRRNDVTYSAQQLPRSPFLDRERGADGLPSDRAQRLSPRCDPLVRSGSCATLVEDTAVWMVHIVLAAHRSGGGTTLCSREDPVPAVIP